MNGKETLRPHVVKLWTQREKYLLTNKTVCTISVIHSQIKEPEKVIALLTEKTGDI